MTPPDIPYSQAIEQLRTAYDGSAAARDLEEKPEWKLAERRAFLSRLQAENKTRLIELGAGTGHDSLFFKDHGLHVVATDLSPEMVAKCQAKGLEAYVMDFLSLSFPPHSFDAAYALNTLLHVPNAALSSVLANVRTILAPNALFYVGTFRGEPFEGLLEDDWHDPPRFFSFRSDEQLLQLVAPHFDVLDFHVFPIGKRHFQALTLRAPD
jgi:SAM-dependent methyltransferase